MHIVFKCKTKWEIKFDNRLTEIKFAICLNSSKEDKRLNRSEIIKVIFHISDTVGLGI